MKYNEIIENIKSGLSGDYKKDTIYLINKLSEYKNSEFYFDLNKEIANMVYKILPENEKNLFSHLLEGDFSEEDKKTEEAYKLVVEKNFSKAAEILESVIQNIVDLKNYDEKSDYKSLESFFELLIYSEIYRKGVVVRPTPLQFNRIYRLYAFSLYRLSRDEDAENAFEKSVYWNPVNVSCMLEFAEIKLRLKKYKSFLNIINDCLKYCYNIDELATIYVMLADYFFQKENLKVSSAMCILSNSFVQNKRAFDIIRKIESKRGRRIEIISKEEMNEICLKYDIQIGFNPEIIGLAAKMGEESKKQGNINAAKYCFDILFKMTADNDVKKMLEKLN